MDVSKHLFSEISLCGYVCKSTMRLLKVHIMGLPICTKTRDQTNISSEHLCELFLTLVWSLSLAFIDLEIILPYYHSYLENIYSSTFLK